MKKQSLIWNTHLTKKEAIAMAKTGWWKTKTPEEIVKFQLFEKKLCMDYSAFHEAIEKVLSRPVWTHEFGLSYDQLQQEYLGKRKKPTMEDILGLLPKEKTIIVKT